MKILFVFFASFSLAHANWAQPKVRCPEEIFPQGLACPDLKGLANVHIDYPSSMTSDERARWANQWASDMRVCRHREILRRESVSAGSFTPVQVQVAWMVVNGADGAAEKLASVVEASRRLSMPPQILIGAITQESLLANLGISPDGGNYSCGVGQLNLGEWCQGVTSLPASERQRMAWPAIACAQLKSALVEPFYELAARNLGSRPAYRITARDFQGITQAQVVSHFPAASAAIQTARFQAVSSFIRHCQEAPLSISMKAQNLKYLFDNFVPAGWRNSQNYPASETFSRQCRTAYPSKQFPMHVGWLLAVAGYNGGPVQTKLVEHYYQVRNNQYPELSPTDLIEALHWGGVSRAGSNRIYFSGQDGVERSQTWYKGCVVQRHVARVIQHVSQPGVVLASSLEQVPCKAGEVPSYRLNSSGIKE